MWGAIRKLWHAQDGVTTLEYVLVLLLIVVAGFLAWSTLGTHVGTMVETGTNSW